MGGNVITRRDITCAPYVLSVFNGGGIRGYVVTSCYSMAMDAPYRNKTQLLKVLTGWALPSS
jgi:hypothetical protein